MVVLLSNTVHESLCSGFHLGLKIPRTRECEYVEVHAAQRAQPTLVFA